MEDFDIVLKQPDETELRVNTSLIEKMYWEWDAV